MIRHRNIIRFGFIIAFLTIVVQFYIINSGYSESSNKSNEVPEPIELAELMFHNQRFMDKLYFSGLNENWEAAQFYHHELEENMESILDANIIEDGLEVSKLAKTLYVPASSELKRSIESKNKEVFLGGYKTMVNSCNNCHNATKKSFIKIAVPESPAFKNQEY